jgi:hypothetical protein
MVEIENNYIRESEAIYAQHNPIQMFRDMVNISEATDEQKQKIIMGSLHGKVKIEDFVTFCNGFIDGVEYEANKRGVMPSRIVLEEAAGEKKALARHKPKDQSITLYREKLEKHINNHKNGILTTADAPSMQTFYDGTKPFLLSLYDNAFLTGVHETYHLYDELKDPDKNALEWYDIGRKITPEDYKGGKTSYDLIPYETRARDEVRAVMVERGLVYTAPICPLDIAINDSEWAAPYLRERAERSFAQNAAPHPQDPNFEPAPTSTIQTTAIQQQTTKQPTSIMVSL